MIAIQVYRKLVTHTDRYLDFQSRRDKKHKTGTAPTLLNWARNLRSTTEAKVNERKHVTRALKESGYSL